MRRSKKLSRRELELTSTLPLQKKLRPTSSYGHEVIASVLVSAEIGGVGSSGSSRADSG